MWLGTSVRFPFWSKFPAFRDAAGKNYNFLYFAEQLIAFWIKSILFLILFIHPDTVLTEVFKQSYLKAFISLRQATPQNCQSTAGLCNDKALKWRSELRLHSTGSSDTASWPQLKWSFARLYLSLPQDYKHQVQLMQGSECQSYTTASPTCGKLRVVLRSHKRCSVSTVVD